jgi:hypothetical protein
VDVAAAHGMGGVVGATWGTTEVVGAAWGATEVSEAGNEAATWGQAVRPPGVAVGSLASVLCVV